MSKRTPTDEMVYEIVEMQKNGLYRRDGLPYRGIRCATRAAHAARKAGMDVRVLPYRPINETAYMAEAVA